MISTQKKDIDFIHLQILVVCYLLWEFWLQLLGFDYHTGYLNVSLFEFYRLICVRIQVEYDTPGFTVTF